jgi:hypothetical protein
VPINAAISEPNIFLTVSIALGTRPVLQFLGGPSGDPKYTGIFTIPENG